MHDYALLRESLANVSRWKGRCVVVHVDLAILSGEKHTAPIIRDALLLKNAGIDMAFYCMGIGAPVFVKQASARGINSLIIDKLSDISTFVESLNAVKVFLLCEGDGVYEHRVLVREMTSLEAEGMLQKDIVSGIMSERVELAVKLCAGCVERVHLINGRKEGALLDELLSSKGSGTMIYRNDPPYKTIRGAVADDVVDVAHVIRDAVDSSIVEEVIARRVKDCIAFIVDGHIHAVAVSSYKDDVIRVEYLAHSKEFDASEVLSALLRQIMDDAARRGAMKITIDPNRAPNLIGIWPWFLKLGFRRNTLATGKGRRLWEKELSKQ